MNFNASSGLQNCTYEHPCNGNQFDQNWGPFAAGSLIASIPIVIIFLSLQPLEIQKNNNKSLNQNYPTSNISKQLKMQTLSTFTSSSISKVSTVIIRMQHQLMFK
jgi:hypothetical protein